MKGNRRDRIIELVSTDRIETQQELATRLSSEGYAVTQATVSRDIRALRLMKTTAPDGSQYYCLPVQVPDEDEPHYARVLEGAIHSMTPAGNLVVVKTAPGMAMACAAVLDRLQLPQIVGSIAGDDTVMAAVRSEEDAVNVIATCKELLGL